MLVSEGRGDSARMVMRDVDVHVGSEWVEITRELLTHGWENPGPGYITAPSQEECFIAWDKHMLNRDAVFGEIGTILPPPGEFFIRPNLDSKSFSGTTMTSHKFEEWRQDLLAIDTYTTIPADTEVMIAPLKTIWAEYRCVMIRGRYVTGSRYKTGRTVAYSPDVGQRIIDYANDRLAEWCPREALVIDIADTPDGLRVIETNAISSSGFYAIDMNLFVGEISALRD